MYPVHIYPFRAARRMRRKSLKGKAFILDFLKLYGSGVIRRSSTTKEIKFKRLYKPLNLAKKQELEDIFLEKEIY